MLFMVASGPYRVVMTEAPECGDPADIVLRSHSHTEALSDSRPVW